MTAVIQLSHFSRLRLELLVVLVTYLSVIGCILLVLLFQLLLTNIISSKHTAGESQQCYYQSFAIHNYSPFKISLRNAVSASSSINDWSKVSNLIRICFATISRSCSFGALSYSPFHLIRSSTV